MGDGWEDHETYNCRECCFLGDQPDDKRRSQWRCTLLGYNKSKWTPLRESSAPAVHMGRLPVYDPEQVARLGNPQKPEEGHEDGCPGGWYRNAFIGSLLKYQRLLTDGGFSSNIMLDRTDDPLVLEAMHYLEQEKLLSRNHSQKVRYDGARLKNRH